MPMSDLLARVRTIGDKGPKPDDGGSNDKTKAVLERLKAMRWDDQAQFHPLKYLAGLTQALHRPITIGHLERFGRTIPGQLWKRETRR